MTSLFLFTWENLHKLPQKESYYLSTTTLQWLICDNTLFLVFTMQVQLVKCLSLSVVFGQAPPLGNSKGDAKFMWWERWNRPRVGCSPHVVPNPDYFLGIFIFYYFYAYSKLETIRMPASHKINTSNGEWVSWWVIPLPLLAVGHNFLLLGDWVLWVNELCMHEFDGWGIIMISIRSQAYSTGFGLINCLKILGYFYNWTCYHFRGPVTISCNHKITKKSVNDECQCDWNWVTY